VKTNNVIRLVSCGLLSALSVSASSAQQMPALIERTSQELGSSAASPLATLAAVPPKAPRVTCSGDQLTISADNSTLRSVLAAVQTCTGVQIDIPESTAGSRTFEELGPGPVREVLASLLNGTNFDFVIGSSDTNPEKVETVLLMLRSKDAPNAPAVADRTLSPARRAWAQSRQNRAASLSPDESPQAADESSTMPATEDAVAAPTDSPAVSAAQVPASDSPPPPDAAPLASSENAATVSALSAAGTSGAIPSSDQGKSTSERISDMQQLFAQRRQMNQSQNSSQSQP
jgi:hypothetical protein